MTLEFYELLKRLNQKGIAVIMVTHDLQAVSYATHILHIDGTHSYFGDKESYLNQELGRKYMRMGGEQ